MLLTGGDRGAKTDLFPSRYTAIHLCEPKGHNYLIISNKKAAGQGMVNVTSRVSLSFDSHA